MNETQKRGWVGAALLVFALLVAGCNRAGEPAALGAGATQAAVAAEEEPRDAPSPEEDEKARVERPALSRQGRVAVEGDKGTSGPDVAGPTPVDLPPVTAPAHDYPPFEGKPIALIHTQDVIGELEPCG